MLQTIGSNEPYRTSEPYFGEDRSQGINLNNYFAVFQRRFFYFLVPFALISIVGLWFAAIQKPNYLSEGKILVETQAIAPDLVRPLLTGTANDRIQLIQQRIMTRDNLLSVANKFGLFPQQSSILELMQQSVKIKPVEVGGQSRPNASTIAFTVGFEYGDPQLAMKVANEFVTLIVNEDARSRTSRATEAVRILTSETKDIEDKLEATQLQIFEVARRPRDVIADIPEQQKSQLAALAALKAEFIEKSSVYSAAHPTVTALKKRIAAMEKTLTQPAETQTKAQSTQADDMEALKRQREALGKRLADANTKLTTARLSEKLDREQQFEGLQVIETPTLPQKPVKADRLKMIGIAFAAAIMLGIGAVVAAELLNGSIRSRDQLSGIVASHLIVSIPYITTRADVVRARLRTLSIVLSVVVLLTILGGLATMIVFGLPLDFSLLGFGGR